MELSNYSRTMKKLRVGRSKLYRMIGSEGLPVFCSGRMCVSADLLKQWVVSRVERRHK